MNSSIRKIASIAGGLLIGVCLAPAVAHASNGDIFVVNCPNCATVSQFRQVAENTAALNAAPGTYVVSSEAYGRTAFVQVTGQIMTFCDPPYYEVCHTNLYSATGAVVDRYGFNVTSEATLERLDEETFMGRRPEFYTVNLPQQYGTSFINSYEGEIHGGISLALSQKGVNVALLRTGTLVLVKFRDGTSAIYVKVINMTYMWSWHGIAWNSAGQQIDRSGNLVWTNPNVSGGGSGYAEYSATSGTAGEDIRFTLGVIGRCEFTSTMRWNGIAVGSVVSIVPC